MLTVNMKKNSTPSVIADNCYQTIKYHLKIERKGDNPQHRLPGLLWSYDASGSRAGQISDLTAHPHLHAILIFPTKMGGHNFDVFIRSLGQRLEKLPGIEPRRGASRPVDLKPFIVRRVEGSGSTYGQLIDFCSYALKGEALLSLSHQHSAEFLTSGVLPFDRFDDDTREGLNATVETVFQNLKDTSKRFRHLRCVNN